MIGSIFRRRTSFECTLNYLFVRWKLFYFRSHCLCHTRSGNVENQSTSKTNFKLLFFGSDNFSIKSLEAVLETFQSPTKINVVVSHENNLVGKYVKGLMDMDSGHCSLQLTNWNEFKNFIRQKPISDSHEFDLGVVASFGHLIPAKVILQCHLGILNVHGSLLPRWRGAAPTAACIMKGENMTGVSIMKIAPHRFDVGPVLHKVKVPVDPHIRTPELTSELAAVGAGALSHVLENLDVFLHVALAQDESEATKAPKLLPEMGHVQWKEQNALEIYNLFRALSGRYKLRTSYQGRLVDLDELSVYARSEDEESKYLNYYKYPVTISFPVHELRERENVAPGHIFYYHKLLCVKCRVGSNDENDIRHDLIFIRRVKINQKWMSVMDFQNGWLSKQGAATHFDSLTLSNVENLVEIKR